MCVRFVCIDTFCALLGMLFLYRLRAELKGLSCGGLLLWRPGGSDPPGRTALTVRGRSRRPRRRPSPLAAVLGPQHR